MNDELKRLAAVAIAESPPPTTDWHEAALTVCRALLAAAPAMQEGGGLPPKIAAIVANLHTQDNRATAQPLFAVQQKRVIGGFTEDYATAHAWVDWDGECLPEESARYDAMRASGEPLPDGVRRVGFIELWEFVTGCMTEQGCKDFIACNGHNLKEPRIYAYSGYRNAEFIAVREWLMSLPAAPGAASPPILGDKNQSNLGHFASAVDQDVQAPPQGDRARFERWYDAQADGRLEPWDVWQAAQRDAIQQGHACVYALDYGGNLYRRYSEPQCKAVQPSLPGGSNDTGDRGRREAGENKT